MIDWYLKIITEHPLVTYLEDGIRKDDPAGWQQLIHELSKHNVDCAVRNWFNSDFETIKEHTAMIQPEDNGEDDDDDDADRINDTAQEQEAEA